MELLGVGLSNGPNYGGGFPVIFLDKFDKFFLSFSFLLVLHLNLYYLFSGQELEDIFQRGEGALVVILSHVEVTL